MTEQEVGRMKRDVETQLDEYEQAINAAKAWAEDYKRRQGGFRCMRRASRNN